jgi:hypothetical protein
MLYGMKAFGFASICCAALALAAADDAFARGGRSGGGSGHSSGHASGGGSARGFSGHSSSRFSGSPGHFSGRSFAGRPGFHGGPHFHSRVFIGSTIIAAPLFFPPPYYSVPAPVYYDPPPPVYIEQTPDVAPPSEQYWYYCPAVRAYYPYVKECAGGWQRVLPNTQSPAG